MRKDRGGRWVYIILLYVLLLLALNLGRYVRAEEHAFDSVDLASVRTNIDISMNRRE